jgi:hypothetical protein
MRNGFTKFYRAPRLAFLYIIFDNVAKNSRKFLPPAADCDTSNFSNQQTMRACVLALFIAAVGVFVAWWQVEPAMANGTRSRRTSACSSISIN